MQQLRRTHEMSVSIFFFGGYPTWTTKHWCSCSKYYIKFIKKKLKTSWCIKKINYFFPSKQKSFSKNICFDMEGTLHPISCNSWKDPWNVGINLLLWGYPTWATKQWCSCSKYYIKLKFSKKKRALSSLSTQLVYERDQLYICDGFLSYTGYNWLCCTDTDTDTDSIRTRTRVYGNFWKIRTRHGGDTAVK